MGGGYPGGVYCGQFSPVVVSAVAATGAALIPARMPVAVFFDMSRV